MTSYAELLAGSFLIAWKLSWPAHPHAARTGL